MNRALLLFAFMLLTTAAMASEPGTIPGSSLATFFQPAPEDLSAWYLANIFGADLVPGSSSSGVRLLSVLFGIFNQVVLTVGIIIIVYTAMAGVLNTAHEGKPMGEKWGSMWLPIRISMGIGLLVPKGGTGYCLAQTMVMWLTLQGIGAADQVWNAMLDYFAQGGAIYSSKTSTASEYMTTENINYTYVLQGSLLYPHEGANTIPGVIDQPANLNLLKLMVCNELFNTSEQAQGDKYEVYTLGDKKYYGNLYFGNRKCGNDEKCYGKGSSSGVGGYECGMVVATPDTDACDEDCQLVREQIYTTANWNMANALDLLAKELVAHPDLSSEDSTYKDYYQTINHNAELYVNYIVGYESLLAPPKGIRSRDNLSKDAFNVYKRYGWILAGNYYTVLSSFKEQSDLLTRHFHPAPNLGFEGNKLPTPKPGDAYDAVDDFFVQFQSTATAPPTAGGKYDIPGYADTIKKSKKSGGRVIGIVNMDNIFKALGKPTNMSKNAGKKGASTVATRSAVGNFIHYLTGEGSNPRDMRVAKDPILRAANYGKSLQIAAMIILPIFTAIYVLAAGLHVCDALVPVGAIADAVMKVAGVPLFSLFLFMYTQGAILGVFIPLIPYLSFFIGVIGWLLQVVEAVAAAPLVAIGLVFPGTKDDVWGQAEPAKMMILALFLRPALMIIGLAAAMMVMWVLTELLNIGFLMLTAVTFRTEDAFGFVTIMMAYTTIFIVVVTRSYSLINVVPNKVLSWIGGHGMDVEGAGEAISAAKGGVEAGAGAVAAGLKSGQDTAEKGVEAKKKYKKEQLEKSSSGGSGTTPP